MGRWRWLLWLTCVSHGMGDTAPASLSAAIFLIIGSPEEKRTNVVTVASSWTTDTADGIAGSEISRQRLSRVRRQCVGGASTARAGLCSVARLEQVSPSLPDSQPHRCPRKAPLDHARVLLRHGRKILQPPRILLILVNRCDGRITKTGVFANLCHG